MMYDGSFADHIIPDALPSINIGFGISSLVRQPGGTGHNIAYGLGLLGLRDQTILVGAVGYDFATTPEQEALVSYDHIYRKLTVATAGAFMITDSLNNQIIPFNMGAMAHAHEQDITPYIHAGNIQYAIISPNDTQAFADHAKLCYTSNIKTFFDPGQSLSFFAPEQLETAMNHAHYCIVNGYEREMLQTKSGKTADELTQMYEVVIITRGAQGADIYSRDADVIHIDAIQCDHVVDPTGAGDAFRAGLIGGLATGLSRADAARQGTRLAHACIQVMGPQGYVV